ncbi:AraC family transcriptional regulator [Chryseobacterium culicis]|uniref:AraC family transcriptional regulator n=1 Tax=Chryseobacterium culicis TaxID=680127 RepID=A0A2S9D005_CHRCI|nr:AraC family transcriptional regulator [Chryseobacterium culicis]PRB86107.1 AraC family transcriptional regulator [Chryseobacterium culicis]PRB91860.1 AraC family transcriptional regulator [Chryseobacterium culicis]
MLNDYKKHELFGKPLLQKIDLKAPFRSDFPVSEQACFLYVIKGEFQYKTAEQEFTISANYSLFLNCISSGKYIQNSESEEHCEIVIVTFYPDILKRIYDRELPVLLQKPANMVSNQSNEKINNDFLIQKYVEGLLFYFENPYLVNEDILILKLKEIMLLLAQSQNAKAIQLILSQLFSPTTYSFKQIIEANLFSQLTIEQLAEQSNLSLSSFKREFNKLYNDTPANYIRNKKLEKAAELLLVSDERITDIAFECGFNDLATFTKNFSDKYRVTPSNYRQEQKGK